MHVSTGENGYALIRYYEGKHTIWSIEPELVSYLCPTGHWTIGWGTTIYPDGTPVRKGDRCSIRQARLWLINEINEIECQVHAILFNHGISNIQQNQFDALISLGYNIGTGEKGLAGSTLIKRIASGAPENLIDEAFLMWTKGRADRDGKDNDGDGMIDEPGEKRMILGLKLRRMAESHLYRHGELKYFTS